MQQIVRFIVSKEFKAAENYQEFKDQLPTGLTVEENKYYLFRIYLLINS